MFYNGKQLPRCAVLGWQWTSSNELPRGKFIVVPKEFPTVNWNALYGLLRSENEQITMPSEDKVKEVQLTEFPVLGAVCMNTKIFYPTGFVPEYWYTIRTCLRMQGGRW